MKKDKNRSKIKDHFIFLCFLHDTQAALKRRRLGTCSRWGRCVSTVVMTGAGFTCSEPSTDAPVRTTYCPWWTTLPGDGSSLQSSFDFRYKISYRKRKKKVFFFLASHIFFTSNVPTFHAVLRNFMYKCMCRLTYSKNIIRMALTEPTQSDTRHTSCFWKHCMCFDLMKFNSYNFFVLLCFTYFYTDMDLCVWNKVESY